MRFIISLLFVLSLSFNYLQAQDEEVIQKVNKAKDRIVAEFSLDQLIGKPDDFKLSAFSRGFNIYFMYDLVLGKSPISIAPGVGIGTNNYYHRSLITSDSLMTYFTPLDKDEYDIKKNKLGLTYVDIPVELRFRSKPNKKNTSWKLATGFKLGFRIADKWKYKGLDPRSGTPGEEVKFKEFNVDNLERLRYGVTLRGGYGALNLFVHYYFSDIFESGKGPGFNPISFGISINGL
jgi:hypothetical protein